MTEDELRTATRATREAARGWAKVPPAAPAAQPQQNVSKVQQHHQRQPVAPHQQSPLDQPDARVAPNRYESARSGFSEYTSTSDDTFTSSDTDTRASGSYLPEDGYSHSAQYVLAPQSEGPPNRSGPPQANQSIPPTPPATPRSRHHGQQESVSSSSSSRDSSMHEDPREVIPAAVPTTQRDHRLLSSDGQSMEENSGGSSDSSRTVASINNYLTVDCSNGKTGSLPSSPPHSPFQPPSVQDIILSPIITPPTPSSPVHSPSNSPSARSSRRFRQTPGSPKSPGSPKGRRNGALKGYLSPSSRRRRGSAESDISVDSGSGSGSGSTGSYSSGASSSTGSTSSGSWTGLPPTPDNPMFPCDAQDPTSTRECDIVDDAVGRAPFTTVTPLKVHSPRPKIVNRGESLVSNASFKAFYGAYSSWADRDSRQNSRAENVSSNEDLEGCDADWSDEDMRVWPTLTTEQQYQKQRWIAGLTGSSPALPPSVAHVGNRGGRRH